MSSPEIMSSPLDRGSGAVERPKAEPEKSVEGPRESSNKIVQAVNDAPPGSIILVSGFSDHAKYTDLEEALRDPLKFTVMTRTDSPAIDALVAQTRATATEEPEKRLIVNVPTLLRDTLFASGTEDGSMIERLCAPSEEPSAVLSDWLKAEEGKAAGDTSSPSMRLLNMFEKIQVLAFGSQRSTTLAMPANSPIVLAFIAAMRSDWHLDEAAIASAREYVAPDMDKTVFLRMENGIASLSVDGATIASRAI